MNWRLKSALLQAIERLPSSASYATYYWLQRHLGRSQVVDVTTKLRHGIATWTHVTDQGRDPRGLTFFEVGSGRTLLVPVAYWLMGARRTITVDLHRYLSLDMVRESLRLIAADQVRIRALFGNRLDSSRFDAMLDLGRRRDWPLETFLDLCSIEYIAPGDAADTGLPSGSVDVHTSYTVFEHIPEDVIRRILAEGTRITGDHGIFVHRVDYSDHFYTFDKGITTINFLKYSDRAWRAYAGNRYAYTNRLRHDDMLRLFEDAGHRIVATRPDVDERALALLRSGTFRLNERFSAKPESVLAISASWIVSAKERAGTALPEAVGGKRIRRHRHRARFCESPSAL